MNAIATTIDRRRLLLGTGATAAALAAASTIAKTAPQMTARERFDFHLAEMKKAATEVQPLVRFNNISEHLGQPDRPIALMILGQWATGRYEGDGVYASSGKYSKRFNVKLLDTKIDGERGFSVIEIGEKDRRRWMTLQEPAFEAFIGPKVSP